jgi:hypothetical protein
MQLSPSKFLRVRVPGDEIVLVDKMHFKELFDAPEEQVSFLSNVLRGLQLSHIFSRETAIGHYHAITMVTKTQLSRHIPEMMPAILDELRASFEDTFKDIGSGHLTPFLARC